MKYRTRIYYSEEQKSVSLISVILKRIIILQTGKFVYLVNESQGSQ